LFTVVFLRWNSVSLKANGQKRSKVGRNPNKVGRKRSKAGRKLNLVGRKRTKVGRIAKLNSR